MRLTVPRALSIIGLVLIVGGLSLAVLSPASFGWFAYAPESGSLVGGPTSVSAVFPLGNLIALGPAQLAGYGAALVGLVLLAAAVGYVLGRRRPPAGLID